MEKRLKCERLVQLEVVQKVRGHAEFISASLLAAGKYTRQAGL
ncbi:MAG: hypothetical protein QME52_02990 [Bacteroidota bacterium]|nr:hypothetical protein [Bacteroidota bacterium]